MKMRDSDFYTGTALAQIIQFSKTVLIKKSHILPNYFEINGASNLLVRLCVDEGKQWQFTIKRSVLNLAQSIPVQNKFYLALVCGSEAICLLTESDIDSIVDQDSKRPVVITVSLAKNNRMNVSSEEWALSRAVPVSSFPKMLFDDVKSDSLHFSWPELSTVNVYDEAPINKFTTDDRHFDLSDLVAKDMHMGEKRKKFVGITMHGKDLYDWLDSEVQRIEKRIHYLFEFDGFHVEIKRVTELLDFSYEKEFIWEIDYWLET